MFIRGLDLLAFVAKFSSVHVRPDSQYSTGGGASLSGRKIEKVISQLHALLWWLQRCWLPPHTLTFDLSDCQVGRQ